MLGTRGGTESYSAMKATAQALSGKISGWGGWGSLPKSIEVSDTTIAAMSSDDAHGSVYADRFRQGAILVPRLFVLVEDGPVQTFATSNQQSVRSRRSTLEKKPWRFLPDLIGHVEAGFVRPVLLGESIVPFRVATRFQGVIPYAKGVGFLSEDNPKIESFPGFAKWWEKASSTYMENRPSDKRTLIEQLNYMGQLEAQFPIAPNRIVYTKSGNSLNATSVTDDRAIIDHKLYWAAVPSLAEGRYLCGVLNAPAFGDAVRPFQSQGAFGPRDFDKYVWRLSTPIFDPDDELHCAIAQCSEAAETVALGVNPPTKGGFKSHRQAVRDALAEAGLLAKLDSLVTQLVGLPVST